MNMLKNHWFRAMLTGTLGTFCVFSPSLAKGQQKSPITFHSFIQAVAKNHPETAIEQRTLGRAKEIERRSGLLPDPQLSLGRDEVPFSRSLQNEPIDEMAKESARWEVNLSQSFPWPGTLDAESKSAQASTEVTRLNVEMARLQRVFGAKELFLRLVQMSKTIQIQQANLEVVESIKKFSHDRFKQGVGSHMEFLQTHSESAVLRRNLANMEADLRNLKREVLAQMASEEIVDIDSVAFELDWPKDEPVASSSDLAQKSILQAKEGELARNDRDYRRTLPSFMATGMFMQEDSGMRMYGAMVGITVPIYSNIQRSSLSNEGSLVEENADQRLAWYQRRKSLALAQVKEQIQQIQDNLKALRDEIIPSAKGHAQAATVEYSQGRIGINAVIDARRNLLNLEVTEVQTIEALNNAQVAAQKIDVGLIDDLNLAVPQLPMPNLSSMSMGSDMSNMSVKKGTQSRSRRQENPNTPSPADSQPTEDMERAPSGGMQGM
jgi:outer membrane protein, heavy metal efflux system